MHTCRLSCDDATMEKATGICDTLMTGFRAYLTDRQSYLGHKTLMQLQLQLLTRYMHTNRHQQTCNFKPHACSGPSSSSLSSILRPLHSHNSASTMDHNQIQCLHDCKGGNTKNVCPWCSLPRPWLSRLSVGGIPRDILAGQARLPT